MKKKILLLISVIVLIVAVIIIVFLLNKPTKLIYYCYTKSDGWLPQKNTVEIYNNGKVTIKNEVWGKEDQYTKFKLSNDELITLKATINNIENTDLTKEETIEDYVYEKDEYVDLNKKIILHKGKNNYHYTNKYVDELHAFINNIKK